VPWLFRQNLRKELKRMRLGIKDSTSRNEDHSA
jgi:hypothetical protein